MFFIIVSAPVAAPVVQQPAEQTVNGTSVSQVQEPETEGKKIFFL